MLCETREFMANNTLGEETSVASATDYMSSRPPPLLSEPRCHQPLLWLRGVPPATNYLKAPLVQDGDGGYDATNGLKKHDESGSQDLDRLALGLWEAATEGIRKRRAAKATQSSARGKASAKEAELATSYCSSASSSATESSFGQTWKGHSLATFDCNIPGRFFGIKTASGSEARSLFLGSRFTAPAEVVGATPIAVNATDAYRSQWFVPSSERTTILSAALFTTIATLVGDAGRADTLRALYFEAREILAGRQKGSSSPSVASRAASALCLSRDLEDGGDGSDFLPVNGGHGSDTKEIALCAADFVVFRAAQTYHADIAASLERQRDPSWRASAYGLYPCAFQPIAESDSGGFRQRRHDASRWLAVTFPEARSVSFGQILATVAVINRIAGRRVARRPLKAEAQSAPCLHIEEAWALVLCRASLLGLASGRCGTAKNRSFVSSRSFVGEPNAKAAIYSGDVRSVAIDACQSAFFSWSRRVAHPDDGAVPASVTKGPCVDEDDADSRAFAADSVSPDAAAFADVQAEAALTWMTSFLCRTTGGRGRRRVRGAANVSVPERSAELLYVILMAVAILAPTPQALSEQLSDGDSAVCSFLRNALGNRRPAAFCISTEAVREASVFLEESPEGKVYLLARGASGDFDAFRMATELAVERKSHDGHKAVRLENTGDLYMHLLRLVVSPRYPRSRAIRLLASLSTYSRRTRGVKTTPLVAPRISPVVYACTPMRETFAHALAGGDARSLCALLFSGAPRPKTEASALVIALGGGGGTCLPVDRRTLDTCRLADLFPLWRPLLLSTADDGEASARDRDGRTCPLVGAPPGFMDCVLGAPVVQVMAH